MTVWAKGDAICHAEVFQGQIRGVKRQSKKAEKQSIIVLLQITKLLQILVIIEKAVVAVPSWRS